MLGIDPPRQPDVPQPDPGAFPSRLAAAITGYLATQHGQSVGQYLDAQLTAEKAGDSGGYLNAGLAISPPRRNGLSPPDSTFTKIKTRDYSRSINPILQQSRVFQSQHGNIGMID